MRLWADARGPDRVEPVKPVEAVGRPRRLYERPRHLFR